MADKVKEIFVDLGGFPSAKKQPAKQSDAIVWIPDSELETIAITFLEGKTPFYTGVLQAPFPGSVVGALVTGPDDTYKYEISVNGVRAVGPEAAPPEIIIDSGSEVPPKGKKSSSKATPKKNAARKPAAVKKGAAARKGGAARKGARKKGAKKR